MVCYISPDGIPILLCSRIDVLPCDAVCYHIESGLVVRHKSAYFLDLWRAALGVSTEMTTAFTTVGEKLLRGHC